MSVGAAQGVLNSAMGKSSGANDFASVLGGNQQGGSTVQDALAQAKAIGEQAIKDGLEVSNQEKKLKAAQDAATRGAG